MSDIKLLTGVYRAIVKEANDPKKLGRLKVDIQTNFGNKTNWVWPMHPSSINPASPDVNQGVWVFFNGSDPEHPVWFGAWGKHKGKSKKIHIKTLNNTVSITGLTTIKLNSMPDGTKEVDLIDSLVAMATMLKNHETRIAALETKSHTH
jgi:hypothetical protein